MSRFGRSSTMQFRKWYSGRRNCPSLCGHARQGGLAHVRWGELYQVLGIGQAFPQSPSESSRLLRLEQTVNGALRCGTAEDVANGRFRATDAEEPRVGSALAPLLGLGRNSFWGWHVTVRSFTMRLRWSIVCVRLHNSRDSRYTCKVHEAEIPQRSTESATTLQTTLLSHQTACT